MPPIHILQAAAVMAIWGLNFVVAKLALAEFSPLLLMLLRFTLVAVVLVPLVPFPRDRLRPLFLYSVVMGGLHFPLIFTGVSALDAATVSIVIQLQVPFASVLAAIFFKDRLGWRRAVGMAVAFVGVAVIAGGLGDRMSWPHLLMVVGAAFAFAFSNIQLKWMGGTDWKTLNAYMALFAVPQLLIMTLLLEENQLEQIARADWVAVACLAYLAVMATVVAYALWFPLVKRYDVNQTMPFLMVVPVFGVGGGVLALGEPFTWSLVIGGILTLAGVGVIILRRPGLTPARGVT